MVLTGCTPAVLDPQGPIGAAERTILIDSLAIMLAIVVPTIVATLAFAWWFRASNTRARYLPDWEYSGRIELIVWSIPLLIDHAAGRRRLDRLARPRSGQAAARRQRAPLEVQVVSLDWKWLFIYPEQGVASVNQLVVPAGVPVHFSLTSASVMNAFFVPQLGSMIYTMNGMTTQLNLQADEPGDLPRPVGALQRRRLLRHALRRARRCRPTSSPPGSTQTRGSGPALDAASYAELAKQSTNVRAVHLSRRSTPDLFEQIVDADAAAGPGPADRADPARVRTRTEK